MDESFSNSTPPGTIYQWAWDFDDPMSGANNTSILQNPTHTFMSGKASYNVSLIATDNLHDCQSSADIRAVAVNPPIPVDFSYNNNVCLDQLHNRSDRITADSFYMALGFWRRTNFAHRG